MSTDIPFTPAAESDDVLQAIVDAAQTELDRRRQLNDAPGQAKYACYAYKAAGGDPADILAAVQDWIAQGGKPQSLKKT